MSRDGFWAPLDPGGLAGAPAELARRLGLRPADDAEATLARLSTVDGLRRYVEAELAALPDGWRSRARDARPIWHIQPPARQHDECGHDLVLLPEPRMFLLTHSNHRSGDWHIERIVAGTTANFLEVEAIVRFAFDLRDFILLVAGAREQNLDSPT